MGKVSTMLKAAVLVAVFAFAGFVTKADTLSGTDSGCTTSAAACWTGITVSATDFGYPGTNVSTDTVLFFTNPSSDPNQLVVSLLCTSGCITGLKDTANVALLYGSPAVFTGPTTAPVVGSTSKLTYNNKFDLVADGGAGNLGPDPGDTFQLLSLGSGMFDINSASINLAFTLPEGSIPTTPEPSSILMFGIGLLSLMGYGLRRRGIV